MSAWRSGPSPGPLPTSMQLGARRGQVEQLGVDQPVVDHHVGAGQQLGPATGEQAGVARARPRPGRRSRTRGCQRAEVEHRRGSRRAR